MRPNAGELESVRRLGETVPKHKTLQGVANSFADSFASPMNYAQGAFVMSELRSLALAGSTQFTLDLLTENVSAQPLTPRALAGIVWYRRQFPDIVARSNSSMAFVREAVLTVTFSASRDLQIPSSPSEVTCELRIVDDRGRTYIGRKLSWWDSEGPAPMPRAARLTRFVGRLARALVGTFRHSSA